MKRILLAGIIMAGTALTAAAQKGSILLYGDLAFASNKNSAETKYTSFEINPGIGYQFNNNWTAGLDLGLSTNKTTPAGTTPTITKSNQFNVGPFVRYTQPLVGPFSFFGQLNASYLSGKTKSETGTISTESKYDGMAVNVFPAIQVNVKNNFALNFNFGGIGYQTTKNKAAGSKSNSSFGLTFGQFMNIGISKNFGGKK
jgi:hypothetical protein